MRILVLDSALGNVRSVASMLRRIGYRCEMVERPVRIDYGDRLILPGIGAFDAGMQALVARGLDGFVRKAADIGCPVLGICLGMQLLCRSSEEGRSAGLGLVPAAVRRLPAGAHNLPNPHMGWNIARPARESRLFDRDGDEQRFYFVHSYYVACDDPGDIAAQTRYGIEFTSAFERDNIMGVQFHPEKSHRFGMALLRRFVSGPTS